MILVSACLAGERCRYDGDSSNNTAISMHLQGTPYIIFCPEVLGGLPIPREPAEIVGGDGDDALDGSAKVVNRVGEDVTKAFLLGAESTLALCRRHGADEVWLKSRSPSCGVGQIYDGTFTGTLRTGDGVTTALLKRNYIKVVEFD